jgi:putative membrane protein
VILHTEHRVLFAVAGISARQHRTVTTSGDRNADHVLRRTFENQERGIMKVRYLALAMVLFASSALAQGIGEKTGVNAMVGAAPSTADFVKMTAISDKFEIESSKLAAERADAASKSFAAKMIEDHTKTSTELKALASKAGVEIPAAMDSAHQTKIDKLNGLKGGDFDKEYDAMQVDAHEDAVSLFERYSKGGDNADLKAFAAKHLPHLQEHLKMARNLRK